MLEPHCVEQLLLILAFLLELVLVAILVTLQYLSKQTARKDSQNGCNYGRCPNKCYEPFPESHRRYPLVRQMASLDISCDPRQVSCLIGRLSVDQLSWQSGWRSRRACDPRRASVSAFPGRRR